MSDYGNRFIPDDYEDPFEQQQAAPQSRNYTWQEAWQKAVTEPNEDTYRELAADPQASFGRAVTWIFFSGLVGGVLSLIAQVIWGASFFTLFGGTSEDAFGLGFQLICGALFIPIGAVLAIIGVAIGVGIFHIVALLLGGKGSYEDMYYATSTFYAPLTIASSALSLIPILGWLLSIPVGIYQLVLQVIAVKSIHNFSWFKAIVSVFGIVIVLIVFFVCCLLTVLAPAVGGVFENIVDQMNTPQP